MSEEGYAYDWKAAFAEGLQDVSACEGFAGSIKIGDDEIKAVYRASEGANDERSWLCVGELRDGRWFYLEASCDYTGWDCQAGGRIIIGADEAQVRQFACGDEARERLYGETPRTFPIEWLK